MSFLSRPSMATFILLDWYTKLSLPWLVLTPWMKRWHRDVCWVTSSVEQCSSSSHLVTWQHGCLTTDAYQLSSFHARISVNVESSVSDSQRGRPMSLHFNSATRPYGNTRQCVCHTRVLLTRGLTIPIIVVAWLEYTISCFVGHEIDELWQHISRREVVRTWRNLADW